MQDKQFQVFIGITDGITTTGKLRAKGFHKKGMPLNTPHVIFGPLTPFLTEKLITK